MHAKRILITGGAGFIGCNAARFFATRNWNVTVLDNLSRQGGEQNLRWLRDGATFDFEEVDIRNRACRGSDPCRRAISMRCCIWPRRWPSRRQSPIPSTDFAVNALGTFHVLDAVRRHCPEAVFIFASTNKVYGKIAAAEYELRGNRYAYREPPVRHQRRASRSISCRRTAARKAPRTSTLLISREYTKFPPRRSASRASTDRGSSASRTKVGWLGSSSLRCSAATSPSSGTANRYATCCTSMTLVRAYEAAIRAPDKVAGQAFNVGGGPIRSCLCSIWSKFFEHRLRPQHSSASGAIGDPATSGSTSATFASSAKPWTGSLRSGSQRGSDT